MFREGLKVVVFIEPAGRVVLRVDDYGHSADLRVKAEAAAQRTCNQQCAKSLSPVLLIDGKASE